MPQSRRYIQFTEVLLVICIVPLAMANAQPMTDRLRTRERPILWRGHDCDPRWVYFKNYAFDFCFVDDTVIPGQQIWLRAAQTNLTHHRIPRLNMVPWGRVYSISFLDSTGKVANIGVEGVTHEHLCDGTLKRGETGVDYYKLKLATWADSVKSLRAMLVGYTWGLVIRFTMYSHKTLDSTLLVRPPIFLTVVEPTGVEVEAESLLQQGKCRELLRRFPQSRLVDEALNQSRFEAGASERLDEAREQARLNPGSPQLIWWIRGIKYGRGVEAYNAFLAQLARDHPGARALEVLKPEK
jgi:hypothetical protein